MTGDKGHLHMVVSPWAQRRKTARHNNHPNDDGYQGPDLHPTSSLTLDGQHLKVSLGGYQPYSFYSSRVLLVYLLQQVQAFISLSSSAGSDFYQFV